MIVSFYSRVNQQQTPFWSGKFFVWGGVWAGSVIGPYFYNGRATSGKYFEIRKVSNAETKRTIRWEGESKASVDTWWRGTYIQAISWPKFCSMARWNGYRDLRMRSRVIVSCGMRYNKESSAKPSVGLKIAIIEAFPNLNANPTRCILVSVY